jgi:hypothetical protein
LELLQGGCRPFDCRSGIAQVPERPVHQEENRCERHQRAPVEPDTAHLHQKDHANQSGGGEHFIDSRKRAFYGIGPSGSTSSLLACANERALHLGGGPIRPPQVQVSYQLIHACVEPFRKPRSAGVEGAKSPAHASQCKTEGEEQSDRCQRQA